MVWSWAEAPEARRRTVASARETRSPRPSEPPHFPVLDFTSLGPRIFVFKLSILPVLVSHGGSSWSCSVSALRVATVTSSHCGTERRFCSGSMRPAKALSWLFWSEAAQEKKTDIYFSGTSAADMAIKGESRCFAFCRIAFCRSGDARAPESKHAFWTDSVLSYLPPFSRGRHCSRHTTNLPAQALRSQRRWPASHGDPRVVEGEKGRGCESGSGDMLGEGDGLGRRRAANARINFR